MEAKNKFQQMEYQGIAYNFTQLGLVNDYFLEQKIWKGEKTPERPNEAQVAFCIEWLRIYTSPRESFNKISSYGFKHIVERWAGNYIANGAFILAAFNEGYKTIPATMSNCNAIFGLSYGGKEKTRFETIYIYALIDPITNEICYIGQAADVNKRFRQHMLARRNGNIPMHNWIMSLMGLKLEPIIQVLGVTDGSQANQREFKIIKKYWDEGHPLLNKNGLGDISTSKKSRKEWAERLNNSEWCKQRSIVAIYP